VLRLLPERAEAVVIVEDERTTPGLRQALEHFEGFATEGDRTVYLRKHGRIFQRALGGASIWDYALACVVWHEWHTSRAPTSWKRSDARNNS
jgi:hypothetical protein